MPTGALAEPLQIVPVSRPILPVSEHALPVSEHALPASEHARPASPHVLPAAQHVLMVCRTCPRFASGKTWLGKTQGEELAQRIAALWQQWASAARFRLSVLTCLGGCPSPCNVALSGPGKWRLRIRHMVPEDAAPLLAIAAAYLKHPNGNLCPEELPSEWPERIGARTPPYAMPVASDPDTQ